MDENYINKLSIETFKILQSGKYDVAESNFKKIIELDPNNIFALNNLGNLFLLKKKYNDSLILFDQVLKIKPEYAEALVNKGNCLTNLNQNNEALKYYKKALNLRPDFINVFYDQGNCLLKLNRYEEALICYKKILDTKPNFYKAINNQGLCFENLHKFEEALTCYKKTIELNPNFAEALVNKGNCFQKLHLFNEAILSYKKAIQINPNLNSAISNLGQLQLLLGNYKEGWKNYESRKQISGLNTYLTFDNNIEWLGDKNLKGKYIYISTEQGLGDYIQFCRYLPMIKELGANIILNIPKQLIPLIDSMNLDYIKMKEFDKKKFYYHCSIMSLPLAFKTLLNNVPNKTPYFFTPENQKNYWKKKLGSKLKKRIGLHWSGNAKNPYEKYRKIDLEKLTKILDLPFEFHSLDIKYNEADLKIMKKYKNLTCHKNEILGFEKTAGLIESMDLVICIDSGILHLCGALNKPTWLLLPFKPDFRWLLDSEDSPWYPSIKIFRQTKQNNWEDVIEKVSVELTNLQF